MGIETRNQVIGSSRQYGEQGCLKIIGKHQLSISIFLGRVRVYFEEIWKLRDGCVGPVGNSHDFVGNPNAPWWIKPMPRFATNGFGILARPGERKPLKLVILWSYESYPHFQYCLWSFSLVTSCSCWQLPMRGGFPIHFCPVKAQQHDARCSALPTLTLTLGGQVGAQGPRAVVRKGACNLPRSTRSLKVAKCNHNFTLGFVWKLGRTP